MGNLEIVIATTPKHPHLNSENKMIYLSFSLRNPFTDTFESLYYKGDKVTKYKSWELQANRTSEVIGVSFSATARQSHAGLGFDIALFGYILMFKIYDIRHWDDDKGDGKHIRLNNKINNESKK